jgi:hypothetical protein
MDAEIRARVLTAEAKR